MKHAQPVLNDKFKSEAIYFSVLFLFIFQISPTTYAASSCVRQDFPKHSSYAHTYWNRATGTEIINSLPGDINQDSQVLASDLALIQKVVNDFSCADLSQATGIVIGSSSASLTQGDVDKSILSCVDFQSIADVNGDGFVNETDLNLIKKVILGLPVEVCACSSASIQKMVSRFAAGNNNGDSALRTDVQGLVRELTGQKGVIALKRVAYNDNVFSVNESGDSIIISTLDGKKSRTFFADYKSNIRALTVDKLGNIYVAGSFTFASRKDSVVAKGIPQILVFNQSGGLIRHVGVGQLLTVEDVAVDSSGNIFVADLSSSVKMFDSCGLKFKTIGEDQNGTILHKVTSVAVSASNELYVLDQVSPSLSEIVKFH